MTHEKINVRTIRSAWHTCNYEYQVWIDGLRPCDFKQRDYIIATLTKWFGCAAYFWDDCFLAGKRW